VKVRTKAVAGLAATIAAVSAVTGLVAGTGTAAQDQTAVKVAVVTDVGGLNDKGFNTLAGQGLAKAKKTLGSKLESRIYITNTDADRTPNLQRAAQDGYQLVIANGVLFTFGPLDTVAPAFADTKFLGIDVDLNAVKGKPTNIRGVQFREQEAGCLVGNIAALEAKRLAGPDIISAVGANKVTAIVRFFAGYQFCAKRANPKVKVITQYANDPTFNDQAKCKATALSQIARGSKVVFQVAGGCGLGAIDAAKQKKVWAIGVDADQYFFGPHVLTSATKHVETAVYDSIIEFAKNPAAFKTGYNANYTAKNGGVGYGRLSVKLPKKVAAQYRASSTVLLKLMASGKVKPPAK
jgi:basic membrane protein A and related proteins